MTTHRDHATIWYLLDDYDQPSWGAGMLYEHVGILRDNGFDARVLHQHSPFRPGWRAVDVSIEYLDHPGFATAAHDVLVIPEVMASRAPRQLAGRRIVFVQGSFLIVQGLGDASSYRELGFESAMAVMPHVADVVERHFGLGAAVVPPFIAEEFRSEGVAQRERRILLAWKHGYAAAGIPDQAIAERLLAAEVARRSGWAMTRLDGFSHAEVAALMRSSSFLVNVFSHEAFNTTVPEAMASGCVPICYEAGGPREYLRHGENAFVFANQQVYPLVEFTARAMDGIDAMQPQLVRMREAGQRTAANYSRSATAAALVSFMRRLLES